MVLQRNCYRPQQTRSQTNLPGRNKMRTKTSQFLLRPTHPTVQLFFQVLTTIGNEGNTEELLSIPYRPRCAGRKFDF